MNKLNQDFCNEAKRIVQWGINNGMVRVCPQPRLTDGDIQAIKARHQMEQASSKAYLFRQT